MDVHHIRYFLAVCDTLNFTRAAEACQVTQPALSRAIQQLEDEVGGLLFRRERSLTHLTDLGLVMKPRLRQIMDDLVHARREARRFLTMDTPSLTIGVMCTIGPARFAGLVAEFGRRHPGVTLRIEEGVPKRLLEKLDQGRVELAIISAPDGLGANLEAQTLYEERFVVGFPTGHRFASMTAVPMRELDGETYLSRINCEYADPLRKNCAERGVTLHEGYASEREDWIQNLIAGGLGVAMIPEFTAVAPGVQVMSLVEPDVWRTIKLVRLKDRQASQPAEDFLVTLVNHPWPGSRFARLPTAA